VHPLIIEARATSNEVEGVRNEKRELQIETIAGIALLLSFAIILPTTLAQRPGGPPQPPDILAGLKHALEEAGAPALSSAQETQLEDLIKAFRQAQNQSGPSDAVQAAHRAYDAAILAGNLSAAQSQATIIANALAGRHQRTAASASQIRD
jgi:hypothetical protein